jgi:hypothetical protein
VNGHENNKALHIDCPVPCRARCAARLQPKEACGDVPNRVDVTEGWNFLMRVYHPGQSVYQMPSPANNLTGDMKLRMISQVTVALALLPSPASRPSISVFALKNTVPAAFFRLEKGDPMSMKRTVRTSYSRN